MQSLLLYYATSLPPKVRKPTLEMPMYKTADAANEAVTATADTGTNQTVIPKRLQLIGTCNEKKSRKFCFVGRCLLAFFNFLERRNFFLKICTFKKISLFSFHIYNPQRIAFVANHDDDDDDKVFSAGGAHVSLRR